jgi:phosphoribosyl-AMP cyclohydrolase
MRYSSYDLNLKLLTVMLNNESSRTYSSHEIDRADPKDVLMFAWMNREALQKTAELGRAVYFSRSRNKLWFKGEESGHVQLVHDIRLDCDNDVILLSVTQTGHDPGIACHTGRHSCFFHRWQAGPDGGQWLSVEPVLQDPALIYKTTP